MSFLSRRGVLLAAPGALVLPAFAGTSSTHLLSGRRAPYQGFPSQDPALVREIVAKSHFDIDAVGALLERQPALAKAAVDWGFGDWESALGAASHMGRVDMAELLLSHGARPDIFTHAVLGNVDAVRALVEASPGIQGLRGPHSFSLLHHARQGREKAASVVEYLMSVGGADEALASAPIDGEAQAAYLGVYDIGGQRLDVVQNSRGGLSIKKPEQFGRSIFPVAEHAFRPTGAEQVRVVFAMDAGTPVSFAVHAPEPVGVAKFISRD